ncbi:Succinate dehydrogenase assembly factor 2 mitochondrial [Malassezia vespertilionis]|uniref:Succinate dehydrogenase assembly factor 2, mitochondrial n=1 Tax=Malassezia vespertilionis TaxID=2020962 RepID=A0A2N1J816_9BASI|nr:Succinate dehydrogenase assembly factor 2 mitochondrial [Malassezia vespertilionis]PKI82679.1 Emi5p [Malassezia vespertilionis]WFD08592.1 Succinate dehydrogenase assembly factor 2 mitochondrial [Malassezia vespertilionis]
MWLRVGLGASVRVAAPARRFAACAPLKNKRNAKDALLDPFPLPFSPDLDPARKADGVDLASASQRVEGIEVPNRVPNRTNEDRPRKLARMQYQCRKRGTLETDLILSTFAQKELASLGDDELDELDRLLDEPDWDIFYWCTERKPVPDRWESSFITEGRLGHRIRAHTRNDERTVRRFPSLSQDIQSPF